MDTGLAVTTARIQGVSNQPLYIGWGDGAGTTARTDTTLFVERGVDASSATAISRTLGTATQVTTTTTNDTWQMTGTRTATAVITVTNSGVFDVQAFSATSVLFLKGDFTGIGLASGDSIAYTIKAIYDN